MSLQSIAVGTRHCRVLIIPAEPELIRYQVLVALRRVKPGFFAQNTRYSQQKLQKTRLMQVVFV